MTMSTNRELGIEIPEASSSASRLIFGKAEESTHSATAEVDVSTSSSFGAFPVASGPATAPAPGGEPAALAPDPGCAAPRSRLRIRNQLRSGPFKALNLLAP